MIPFAKRFINTAPQENGSDIGFFAWITAKKQAEVNIPHPGTSEAAEFIKSLLLSALPTAAPGVSFFTKPEKEAALPDRFIILSLPHSSKGQVQLELFCKDLIDARHDLHGICTRLAKIPLQKVEPQRFALKAERLFIHSPTLPNRVNAACSISIGRVTGFTPINR